MQAAQTKVDVPEIGPFYATTNRGLKSESVAGPYGTRAEAEHWIKYANERFKSKPEDYTITKSPVTPKVEVADHRAEAKTPVVPAPKR